MNRIQSGCLKVVTSLAISGVFLASILSPAFVQAQSSSQPRILHAIDESSLVRLPGNVHPLAQTQFDRGPAPASLPATRLQLVLKRSPQQQAALEQYLAAVQDQNSSSFRHFLSPEEFGRSYGVADSDLQQVTSWLEREGFSVAKINKGKTSIEFSGTVSQLTKTFHTAIHRFVINGQEHYANVSDPMIPSALADVVAGVSVLNDFHFRQDVIKGPNGKWDAAQHRFVPDLTITGKSGLTYLYVGPGDAATIYNAPTVLNANLKAGQTTYDGTGITIGIAAVGDTYDNDVSQYRSIFGLPSLPSLPTVVDGNGPTESDATEATLDAEIAGALAPGANLVYYTAVDTTFQSGLILAILRAIDDNAIHILNVSYSGCELAQGAGGNQEILNIWEQAAAQGIAVTVSAGDSGSANCDDPDTETSAVHGFGINGLASTPYTVAVGGTDFDTLSSNFSKYVGATNGPHLTSALSYIPENPWNDSTNQNGLSANNKAYIFAGQTDIVAGGGGASSAGSYSSTGALLGGYAKPLWQQMYQSSAGIASDKVRDIPDISLFASNGFDGAVWATCGDGLCGSSLDVGGIGGTSASAPAFAGILALVNQKLGASVRLGQPNWVLYKLAQTTPSIFHQITTGNNSVLCKAGTPNCGSNGFLTGYDAATGYNKATGLGSLDVSALVNAWSSVALTATTTTLSLDKSTVTHGQPISIQIGIDPSAATGNVAVITDANEKAGAVRSDAQASYPLETGKVKATLDSLPGGSYDVYANYGGDGTYAGSTSAAVPVTIAPEPSITPLTVETLDASGTHLVSLAGGTAPYGAYISIDSAPYGQSQASSKNPVTDATGNVDFNEVSGLLQQPNATINSTGNAEVPTYGLTAGTYSLTAQYSGDNSYMASTSPTVSFTISKVSATISVGADAAQFGSVSENIYANIVPVSYGVFAQAPTGSAQFTDTTTGVVLGTGSISYRLDSTTGHLYGQASVNVSSAQIASGANKITATYSGDSNYKASGPSAAYTLTCTSGCYTSTGQSLSLSLSQISPPSGGIPPGRVLTVQVAISSGGGFSGNVKMSCAVQGLNAADADIPTCSFNPATVGVSDANHGTTTLSLNTTAPVIAIAAPKPSFWNAGRGGLVLACAFFLWLPSIRRRRFASCLILTFALIGISACGGGGSGGGGGGGGNPGTTPDTYTVTFRVTDSATGTITAEDDLMFSVQ